MCGETGTGLGLESRSLMSLRLKLSAGEMTEGTEKRGRGRYWKHSPGSELQHARGILNIHSLPSASAPLDRITEKKDLNFIILKGLNFDWNKDIAMVCMNISGQFVYY